MIITSLVQSIEKSENTLYSLTKCNGKFANKVQIFILKYVSYRNRVSRVIIHLLSGYVDINLFKCIGIVRGKIGNYKVMSIAGGFIGKS